MKENIEASTPAQCSHHAPRDAVGTLRLQQPNQFLWSRSGGREHRRRLSGQWLNVSCGCTFAWTHHAERDGDIGVCRRMLLVAVLFWLFIVDIPCVVNGFEHTEGSGDLNSAGVRVSSLAVAAVFDEQILADNVSTVRDRAARLPDPERFEYLANWVLPSMTHSTIRMTGEFTPTNPPPTMFRSKRDSDSAGAELVSPAYDLLDVATKLERLVELRTRIESIPRQDNDLQQRARAAMLVLINLELDNGDAAEVAFKTLQSLAQAATPTGMYDQWPETMVAWRGMHRFAGIDAVGDLVSLLYAQRTQHGTPAGIDVWHSHIKSLTGRNQHLQLGGNNPSFDATWDLKDWIPVVRSRSDRSARGHAQVRWHRGPDDSLIHQSGHDADYLLYRCPLSGNFQVDGEIAGFGRTQVHAVGSFWGTQNELTKLYTGTFRDRVSIEELEPPFTFLRQWVRFRIVFHEGTSEVFLNGRLVHREQLPQHHSPWIGIRSWWHHSGGVRHVQITGTPTIPEAVNLAGTKDIPGWVPYHQEILNDKGATWHYRDDPDSSGQIVGMHQPWHDGTFFNSLLHYHRPLSEDGSVEYDFFYQPENVHTHPALGRLAFLLNSDGVRLHCIADSPFDQTDLPPDNALEAAGQVFNLSEKQKEWDSNLSPNAKLPLRSGDWNHVKLSVAGDMVVLELNGRQIYDGALAATNTRTFGLFHFAEQTEVRVRNVTMKGDWPRSLPSAADQELADHKVVMLDETRSTLPSSFEHDFMKDGLPDGQFVVSEAHRRQMKSRDDGLFTSMTAHGPWTTIHASSRLQLHGDFDVEARFDQLRFTGDEYSGIHLNVNFTDKPEHICRLLRSNDDAHHDIVQAQVSELRQGERTYVSDDVVACGIGSGRLRLARRGETVYYLVGQGDQGGFQLIGERRITSAPTTSDGIVLQTTCNGSSSGSVVWKHVRIAAQEIVVTTLQPAKRQESLPEALLPKGNSE